MNPILSFELLFFAVFGQTTTEQTHASPPVEQPAWTEYLYKIVFGIYMLVSVVVLINLLIAMMSDTYQRIQVMCGRDNTNGATIRISLYTYYKHFVTRHYFERHTKM